ncbi:hypothetical protein [Nocardioides sp.]|uniref:hypothetical protein n=1 Tax=Nocardioides sp. TaxID=35761 RepID=UPI00356B1D25
MPRLDERQRGVLRATVTPLASIFGSGFLIIVPVLERTTGAWSPLAIAGVCALAWVVGSVVRHVVREVEPRLAAGDLGRAARRLERGSDVVIVVAYVISVALYLRIMAEYIVEGLGLSSPLERERAIAVVAIVAIVVLGVRRGFTGLDFVDRVALGSVLLLVVLLSAYLLVHDVGLVAAGDWPRPPPTGASAIEIVLVLGGILITVQGFETVRFLGDEFDAETRIWASRLAQIVASVVYIGFVVLATPLMGTSVGESPDATLLDLVARLAAFLVLPLVLVGTLSQLAAAVADTAAAEGNLHGLGRAFRGPRAILISGVVAAALAATMPLFSIIAVASRAFALYYALQCLVALSTTKSRWRRVGLIVLALALVGITVFARPVG